jgi:hypothetical protein
MQLAAYFREREIVLEEDLGSTKTELTAILRVPSAVGDIRFYGKAKVKKTATDGDLASAYLEAQQRGYPLLFLAAGTLSKKAIESLPALKGVTVVYPWRDDNDTPGGSVPNAPSGAGATPEAR